MLSIILLLHRGWNRAELVLDNQHYLKAFIEVYSLALCSPRNCRQGHCESFDASNKANFLSLHWLLFKIPQSNRSCKKSHGMLIISLHICRIRNILLHIVVEMARDKVCTELRDTCVYSTLALQMRQGRVTKPNKW